MVSTAPAASIVPNGDFEFPVMANPGDTTIMSWSGGPVPAQEWTAAWVNAAESAKFLKVDAELDAGQYEGDNVAYLSPKDGGYIFAYQDVSLTGGQQYYIGVRVGRGNGQDYSSSFIQLWSGNTIVSSAALLAGDPGAPAEGKMVWLTTTYTPAATGSFDVVLASVNNSGVGYWPGGRTNDYPTTEALGYFDQAWVSTEAPPAIPEPASLTLLGLGGSLLLMKRRRLGKV